MSIKRGYSRDFKPHGDSGKRYLLDEIPAGLWADVKATAKSEGVSIRALILTLLKKHCGEKGKRKSRGKPVTVLAEPFTDRQWENFCCNGPFHRIAGSKGSRGVCEHLIETALIEAGKGE